MKSVALPHYFSYRCSLRGRCTQSIKFQIRRSSSLYEHSPAVIGHPSPTSLPTIVPLLWAPEQSVLEYLVSQVILTKCQFQNIDDFARLISATVMCSDEQGFENGTVPNPYREYLTTYCSIVFYNLFVFGNTSLHTRMVRYQPRILPRRITVQEVLR
jgi:hypothetical protein